MGSVNGDLNRRRGQIDKMEPRPGNVSVVTAFVPLSEMFGYTTDLRSFDAGTRDIDRCTLSVMPRHRETWPKRSSQRLRERAIRIYRI